MTRRSLSIAATAVLLGTLCGLGCNGDGNFKVFGYTTRPPYDPNIRSVYVPAFKMSAFHAGAYRGLEVDITQALVDELNHRKSPIRVVSDPARADTELIGTIVQLNKNIYNRTQQNLNREFEVALVVDVVWRDLRSGKILSGARPPAPPTGEQFDPSLPPPPDSPPDGVALPLRLQAFARVLPELGETDTTGQKAAAQQLARQLVNLMEAPW